ncbi:MAG: ABC transporter permease [Chitinivibrionales bacterium]|nr:ABC transporter permease [Chitinivibrionales bacterium]
MTTIDMSLLDLVIIYALLAIPLAILLASRIALVRKAAIAIARMSVQLALVGFYLRYIFELNNVFVNFAWVSVMILVANANVLGTAGLSLRKLFPVTVVGIALSTLAVLAVFVFGAVQPTPLYDARYMIPLTGMILGNCMRGNVISLERFFSAIARNEKEYTSFIFMGATVREATLPYFRQALAAALSPTVTTMATMGIVSLPGMMTGQILGGSSPVTAIKYQMAIMVAIFVTVALGAYLNLLLSMRVSFDRYGMLRREVMKKP